VFVVLWDIGGNVNWLFLGGGFNRDRSDAVDLNFVVNSVRSALFELVMVGEGKNAIGIFNLADNSTIHG
jgi:hypothetical protein